MHESSFFQLLPATGWFSSRREPKGIICSLTNLFVSTAVSCLFRKTTEKQEFVWIRQSQTKLALLVARDNNLLQKKKIKGNSLKNVIETECSFTIKNRTQASMFLQNVGGFFQVQKKNGSIATSSRGNLLPKPGPLQCWFQCLNLDTELGSKTIWFPSTEISVSCGLVLMQHPGCSRIPCPLGQT